MGRKLGAVKGVGPLKHMGVYYIVMWPQLRTINGSGTPVLW